MAEASENDINDPSLPSSAWSEMAPKWQMSNTLLGGTEAMRDAGMEYLPKHSKESDSNYDERLSSTTLFNQFEITLDSLVGKPFGKPIVFSDDMPEETQNITENIDMQGNNLGVFTRDWMREGIAKGFSHCLVDFPYLTPEARVGRTLADDISEGRRPYWVRISPENLIFASASYENGQEKLNHVRIKECITERVGFSEVEKERIRILEPGLFQIWEKREVKVKNRRKIEWIKIDEGYTGLDFIPLVTFYANRRGLMLSKPPLEDLGYLNVRHWQSTSDQINVLTVARFPMLAVSGATDYEGGTMAIGPKQLLGVKEPNGRFYYVEHSGKAIASGKEDLHDLEDLMAAYGAQFLKKRPGGETATGRALDTAEATSPLQDMTFRFNDAVNTALYYTSKWMSQDNGGTVKYSTDFGSGDLGETGGEILKFARQNGDLSREYFLSELKRRRLIADEFDYEKNDAELEEEKAGNTQDMQTELDMKTKADKEIAASKVVPIKEVNSADQGNASATS